MLSGEVATRRRTAPKSTAEDRFVGTPSAGATTVTNPRRQDEQEDGLGGIVKRVFSSGPTPEERLEQLLAERRRELDETAARFDASIADLERREELLRDSRASVERMLRLGRNDLEARENELVEFLRELTEREGRVVEAEADIARRRQELGAVELKRATIERRERDVAARETEVAELEAQVAELEVRLAERPEGDTVAETVGEPEAPELAFVPGPAYRLVELAEPPTGRGASIVLDGVEYVVGRVGPSPLPGDGRRCAYLVASSRAQGRGDTG
jgi:hypothetical protein